MHNSFGKNHVQYPDSQAIFWHDTPTCVMGRVPNTNPRVKKLVFWRRAMVPSWVTFMFCKLLGWKRSGDSSELDAWGQ